MEGEHSLGTPLATCALCRQAYSLRYLLREIDLSCDNLQLAPGRAYSVLVSDREWRNRTADCEPVEG